MSLTLNAEESDYDVQNNNMPLYAEKYFGLSNCGALWTADEVVELH